MVFTCSLGCSFMARFHHKVTYVPDDSSFKVEFLVSVQLSVTYLGDAVQPVVLMNDYSHKSLRYSNPVVILFSA